MILVFFVRKSHGGSNRTRPARPILRVGRTAADVSKGKDRAEGERWLEEYRTAANGNVWATILELHIRVRFGEVVASESMGDKTLESTGAPEQTDFWRAVWSDDRPAAREAIRVWRQKKSESDLRWIRVDSAYLKYGRGPGT